MNARKNGKFSILSHYTDSAPFIEQVIAAADQNKNALGFFAEKVFHEFARSEQLYIAIEIKGEQASYVGHLMFKYSFPRASVLQMFVSPLYRNRRIATMLLDKLKSALTTFGFISIYARVAEDLTEANTFWENQNFYVQRVEAGGATRKRMIVVRSHELASPQLFTSSGFSSDNPLGLDVTTTTDVPLFLLDLNVLFDLGPRRPRHEDTLDLFRADRMGICRLAVSAELKAELQRTAPPGRTDPMQAYPKIFCSFPLLMTDEWKKLSTDLAFMVFPKKDIGHLSDNDKSDLRHLVTAIQHHLAGFITNDGAILEAAPKIKERYNIQILSPIAFKQSNDGEMTESAFNTPSAQTLNLIPIIDTDEPVVQRFLTKLNLSSSAIASDWAAIDSGGRVCIRHGVWCNGQLLGYLTRPSWKTSGDAAVARIAIDESAEQAREATYLLLAHFIEQVQGNAPIQVKIQFPPHQVHVREVASGLGFGGTPNQPSLSKIILGRIVTHTNWRECRDALISATGLKLPDMPPNFRHISQQVQLLTPDGNKTHIPLDLLGSVDIQHIQDMPFIYPILINRSPSKG